MGGAVFAQADGVVRPAEDDLGLADGGQTNRPAHVVAEVEEGATDRQHAAVEGHAVHGAAHRVFADAEVDEASTGLVAGLDAVALQLGACVAGEIGTAGHEPGHDAGDGVDDVAAGHPSSHRLVARLPAGEARIPALDTGAGERSLELRVVAAPSVKPLLPLTPKLLTAGDAASVEVDDLVGSVEVLIDGKPEDLLCRGDLFRAEREPVGVGVVGHGRRRIADVAPQDDQRRPVFFGLGPVESGLECVEILRCLADGVDMPSVCLEPFRRVVTEGQFGRTVDRDVVVVVDVHEATEAEMAGERRRLMGDALLEIAVAAEHEDVMIADLRAESCP